MADEFDLFLEEALAPEKRDEDHRFVARVQAAIRIEERLKLERRSMVRNLILQLVALSAVAAAVLLGFARAPVAASLATESPWLAVLILMAGFGLLIALLSGRGAANSTSFRYFSSLTN
jgi:hypothetical protein